MPLQGKQGLLVKYLGRKQSLTEDPSKTPSALSARAACIASKMSSASTALSASTRYGVETVHGEKAVPRTNLHNGVADAEEDLP